MGRVRYAAKPAEERRNREVEATSVGAWADTLTVIYETDANVAAAVLPPPLQPAEPLVRVTVASVAVNGRPPFGAGSFSVRARHEGIEGDYALVMPMTTEQSVVGGRETFGEPKKLATIDLKVEGDLVNAWYERMGVRFLEIDGRIAGDLEPTPDRTRTSFYLKFLPAVGGKGFDSEPQLVYCRREETTRSLKKVDADIILRESRFDPVADLPVRNIRSIELAERSSIQTGEVVTSVPADWVTPFVHQRYDDLSPVGSD
ncbi:MAG TPA: acetoacetate decarboxylase family protein [Mycobacteriales bacterium]|nr:acetoacetate decarboxylase family protein [Mycobacteriales bacterium]